MSVSKVTGVVRVEAPAAAARPNENPVRAPGEARPPDLVHEFLEEPAPRRFPWLSWQTRELEVASKQPSPYGNIPLLGKELDHKA
jgi:hypothetical protein